MAALTDRALRGIAGYRASRLHERSAGCCRFTPTCSHYAEDALRRRGFAVALVLVAWRLLRCNPLTPYGTADPVPPRRPGFARRALTVVGLAGLTTFLVAGTAAAMQSGGGSGTAGGCDAFVAGVPIGNLTVDHPLQVHKGQKVLLTGLSPIGIRSLPSTAALRSTTDIKIHFIEKLATTTLSENATGQRFQRVVNVDAYLKYGSGVYRVDVHSVAPGGWDCAATFYVELHGSKLAAEVAVAVGAVGAAGVYGSARGGEPPKPDENTGEFDPAADPEVVEKAQAPRPDRGATGAADGGVGCLAGILFALMASTGAFATAVPVPVRSNPHRVWVKGHPVLGFVSGLIAGLGITIALQQLGYYPLTLTSAIIAPLVTAVLGAVRARLGRAWKVG
jgi:putative membrane protein insertion efficiency factor